MDIIDIGKENNFLIFGKKMSIGAAQLLKSMKLKASEMNFCYISIEPGSEDRTIVVCTVNDKLEVTYTNTTFPEFFTRLSREVLQIIVDNGAVFDIGCNVTAVFDAFLNIDIEIENRLLTANYSDGAPDLSRSKKRMVGRELKDLELINFKHLHHFDCFLTRMTTFKGASVADMIEPVRYYMRITQ